MGLHSKMKLSIIINKEGSWYIVEELSLLVVCDEIRNVKQSRVRANSELVQIPPIFHSVKDQATQKLSYLTISVKTRNKYQNRI